MEAIRFFKEFRRFCDTHDKCKRNGGNCPFYESETSTVCGFELSQKVNDELQGAILFIQQWAKDNPVKTYWDVFKERNPDMFITARKCIMLDYSPEKIFGIVHDGMEWSDEYKEVTK